MSHLTKPFSPTEVWTPDAEDFELEDYIYEAIREINQADSNKLIHDLKQKKERTANGVKLAILDGNEPENYSQTEALVLFNPHANTDTANMLVRGEFIRRVAKKADVRDATGKLKPVIMIAAPGIGGSKLKLTDEERRQIKGGELGLVAQELLRGVSEKGVGKVALLGFSEGGDITLAAARNAYNANLDIGSFAAGDPAGVKDRSEAAIGIDFLKAGSSFQSAIDDSDINAQKKAIGAKPYSFNRNKDFFRFGGVSLLKTNRNLWSGLTHDVFEDRMREILREGKVEKAVVGYGGEKDTIANPAAIEPSIQNIYEEFGPESFMSIRVENATHSWGDNLPLLAKLYMRALI